MKCQKPDPTVWSMLTTSILSHWRSWSMKLESLCKIWHQTQETLWAPSNVCCSATAHHIAPDLPDYIWQASRTRQLSGLLTKEDFLSKSPTRWFTAQCSWNRVKKDVSRKLTDLSPDSTTPRPDHGQSIINHAKTHLVDDVPSGLGL